MTLRGLPKKSYPPQKNDLYLGGGKDFFLELSVPCFKQLNLLKMLLLLLDKFWINNSCSYIKMFLSSTATSISDSNMLQHKINSFLEKNFSPLFCLFRRYSQKNLAFITLHPNFLGKSRRKKKADSIIIFEKKFNSFHVCFTFCCDILLVQLFYLSYCLKTYRKILRFWNHRNFCN